MIRNLVIAGMIASASLATPALAETAPAAAAAGYSTADSSIGSLLDDPAAKAIIDKYMPGFTGNPQIDMARGMTLKQIQQFAPDQVKDETLAKIDIDLGKLPAKK